MVLSQSDLEVSFQYCTQLARQSGSNFYYAFLTLPPAMFRDMCALYAFMRVTDDIGDDECLSTEDRRQKLTAWRNELTVALNGEPSGLLLPALTDVVHRHSLPPDYLIEVINGVESDLSPRTFTTFQELDNYCYQVAGVVGLCSLHIWGFDGSPESCERGIACGTAFQLINILRDLKEDATRGRIYLPDHELTAHGYSAEELVQQQRTPEFQSLMTFQVGRAWDFFEQATPLIESLPKPGQRILSAMFEIYGTLLTRIEQQQFDVFSKRIKLSRWEKLSVCLRCLCGLKCRIPSRTTSLKSDG